MALDRYPSYGAGQPGMVEIGRETTLATLASSMSYIRTIDNPGGLESIHKLMLEDGALRQTLNRLPMIPGYENGDGYFTLPEGTSVTVRQYVTGFSSALPTAGSDYTTAGGLGAGGFPGFWPVYATLGGLQVQAVLGETEASSTVQGINVADDTGFAVGCPLTVDISATATPSYQTGWIKTITGGTPDVLTLRVDLGTAPGDEKGVYGAIVAYAKSYLSDSYSIRWTGHKVDTTTPLRCTLVGCVPSQMTISVDAFGLATIETEFMVTAAMWDDASATGVTPQTWTYPGPEQALGYRVQFIPGMAHDAGEDIKSASLSVTVSNGLKQLPSIGAEFGPFTYVKTAQDISVEMHAPYHASLRQAYSDQDAVGVEIELGNRPGKRVAIALPGLTITSFSGPVDDGGVAYCDVTMMATHYGDDTGDGDDDDAIDKPIAIAWC